MEKLIITSQSGNQLASSYYPQKIYGISASHFFILKYETNTKLTSEPVPSFDQLAWTPN